MIDSAAFAYLVLPQIAAKLVITKTQRFGGTPLVIVILRECACYQSYLKSRNLGLKIC